MTTTQPAAPTGEREPVGAAVRVAGATWTPYGLDRPVLDRVDLQVAPGERVLLAGASGSGKSTLLRALAGVLEDTGGGELTGTVDVDGQPGLLLQDPSDAVVARTVGRDVAFGPECAGVPRSEIWGRVEESLAAVSFPYGEGHETQALSGGEAQRLALAGVLALRPGLLLLDEPCSMLDPVAAASVRDAVARAVDRTGATLVVVEHRLEHWVDVCDRLVVLGDQGRVVADGPLRATLAEQVGGLTDLGLWVPGVPAPEPVHVDLAGPVAPGPVAARVERHERQVQDGLASWQVVHPPRVVLEDVAVEARPGELVALTGESGAGKSTLLGLLGGMSTPTCGDVALGALAGPPASAPSRDLAAAVGWVPQSPELPIVARTVLDEVLATSRALGHDEADARARAESLLDVVGLGDRLDTDPRMLSGGEQRRLALVAAVVHRPGVLLLDEPTVGQDRATWSVVAGLARACARAGTTVVAASHDRDLVARADREERVARAPGPMPEARRRRAGLASYASPLPLLLVMVVAMVVGLGAPTVTGGLVLLGVEVAVLLVLCGLRWPQAALRLLPLAVGAASLWWSNWVWAAERDAYAALLAPLRMTSAALPSVVLAAYLEPFVTGDHLAQRLRLPARPVVAATVAMQRFDELRATWGELRGVRRVRGLLGDGGGSWGSRGVGSAREAVSLTFALLVLALRQAGRMAVAMEARGYSSPVVLAGRRTWAEPARWGRTDAVAVVLAALLGALGVLIHALGV